VNSTSFVLLNLGVVTALVVLILLVRKRSRPTPLRMQESSPTSGLFSRQSRSNLEDGQSTRSLTVYFQFNGESWEAHEVLGIPAGSELRRAREAYNRCRVSSPDPHSCEFFKLALNALEEFRKNQA